MRIDPLVLTGAIVVIVGLVYAILALIVRGNRRGWRPRGDAGVDMDSPGVAFTVEHPVSGHGQSSHSSSADFGGGDSGSSDGGVGH